MNTRRSFFQSIAAAITAGAAAPAVAEANGSSFPVPANPFDKCLVNAKGIGGIPDGTYVRVRTAAELSGLTICPTCKSVLPPGFGSSIVDGKCMACHGIMTPQKTALAHFDSAWSVLQKRCGER